MGFKTDTIVVYLIRMGILVSVDNAQVIFVSFNKNMRSMKDTNKVLNVTIPEPIQICGSKLIIGSFTEFPFEY
jgi:hypothetical protein